MKVVLGMPLALEAAVTEIGAEEDGIIQVIPKVYSKKTTFVNILSVYTKDDSDKVHYRGKIRVNVRNGHLSISNDGDLIELPCPLDTGVKGGHR